MTYLLDGNEIRPAKIDGPNRATTARKVRLLNSGTSTIDEVLQQGSSPGREWTLRGRLTDAETVDALEALHLSHASVAFVDPSTSLTVSVRVLDLDVTRSRPWLWDYTMTLIEAG